MFSNMWTARWRPLSYLSIIHIDIFFSLNTLYTPPPLRDTVLTTSLIICNTFKPNIQITQTFRWLGQSNSKDP